MKKYTAWHFSNDTGTLQYGDERRIVEGQTLSIEGTPKLCARGLHGSPTILDALTYASGTRLWKVEIWGKVDKQSDKLCGQHRKAIKDYGDILPLIVEFAQWCADRAKQHAAYATLADNTARAADNAARAARAAAAARAADNAARTARAAAAYTAAAAAAEHQQQIRWWNEHLK